MRKKIILALLVFGLSQSITSAEQAGWYKADLGTKVTPWGRLHSFDGMRPKYTVAPDYPDDAKRAEIGGEVGLAVLVSENGIVEDVKILKGSGNQELDQAALKAVKHWRYQPLKPRERFVSIQPIVFTLQ